MGFHIPRGREVRSAAGLTSPSDVKTGGPTKVHCNWMASETLSTSVDLATDTEESKLAAATSCNDFDVVLRAVRKRLRLFDVFSCAALRCALFDRIRSSVVTQAVNTIVTTTQIMFQKTASRSSKIRLASLSSNVKM